MEALQLSKHIILVKSFLSEIECNSFIEKSEKIGFEEAKVNIDGKQTLFKMIRNNERIIMDDPNLAQNLWNKSKPFIPGNFGDFQSIGLNERLRFYKYSAGHRFKMHRDGSFIRNENEMSFFTFMIYLNANFEGGETAFKNGIVITPEQGDLLLFHHPLKHEGRKIISGYKYVLRSDVMYKERNNE